MVQVVQVVSINGRKSEFFHFNANLPCFVVVSCITVRMPLEFSPGEIVGHSICGVFLDILTVDWEKFGNKSGILTFSPSVYIHRNECSRFE